MSDEPDFSARLHELRMRELRSLPRGARTVLHGGASERWYLPWFEEHYPDDTIERHIMVEAFKSRPDDLPDNADWLQRTLGDLSGVDDGSVDLVFAGQVIEHLWPEDVAGFLIESRRVLADGGHLVLDSPNRRVTEAIEWHHPQHTFELSAEEMVLLARASGFIVESIRGVLLSYDEADHQFIPIEVVDLPGLPWDQRAELAGERPEDSFIWWLVARPDPASRGDRVAVQTIAQGCFERFRARRLLYLNPRSHPSRGAGRIPAVAAGDAGPLIHGPFFPVDHGDWRATFALKAGGPLDGVQDTVVGWVDAVSDTGDTAHARRDVVGADLARNSWTAIPLDFSLGEMTMGVELRAFSTGVVPLVAQVSVDLRRPEDVATPFPAADPRARELASGLARKVRERAGYERVRITRAIRR